jgi:hypothetical protein
MLPGYLPRASGRLSKLLMAACAAWGCSQAEDEGQLHCLVGCDEKVVKLHFSKELEPGEYQYVLSFEGVTGVCTLGPEEDYSLSELDSETGGVIACFRDGVNLYNALPKSVRLQVTSDGAPLIDEVFEPLYETHVIECNGLRCTQANIDVAMP